MSDSVNSGVKKAVISIHLLSAGPSLSTHKVISIGLYAEITIGENTTRFSRKYTAKINQPTFDRKGTCIDYGDFDKDYWDNFYSKLSEKNYDMLFSDYELGYENSIWVKICNLITSIYQNYPPNIFDYIFLCTDSIMLSILDFYTEKINQSKTIRFVNKQMLPTICINDLLSMLSDKKKSIIDEKIGISTGNLSKSLSTSDEKPFPLNTATNNTYIFKWIQEFL